MKNKVDEFKGEYRFLSNFYPASVQYGGIEYPTVENYYQAQKTLDIDERYHISRGDAYEAKRASYYLKIRPDWEDIKIGVMRFGLCQKFHKGTLMRKLLETEDMTLEEGNTWGDTFWGIDLVEGKGQNHLGKLLMELRSVRLGQLTVALSYLLPVEPNLQCVVDSLMANRVHEAIKYAKVCQESLDPYSTAYITLQTTLLS
jgi:ribA/ribD-fused uncharacterized protein